MYRVLLVSLFTLLCACSTLSNAVAVKPEVKVVELAINEISFYGIGLDVVLNVENNNPFSFNVNGIDYLFKINGQQLIKDKFRQRHTVAANSNTTISVPLKINFSSLKHLLLSMDKISSVGYEVETLTYVELPRLGKFEVPSTYDGSFKLSDILRVPM